MTRFARPLFCLLLLCAPAVYAAGPTIVNLTGQAQREVDNDETTVVLYAQENGSDAAKVADAVNRALRRGIQEAKAVSGVEVSGGGVRTWPNYGKNNRIDSWQARGDIQLVSRNSAALAELTGKLQSYLQLEQVNFSISREQRKQVENALIPDAIDALRTRARSVGQSLGKPSMNISELTVGSNMPGPRPMMLMQRSKAESMSSADVSTPTREAGKQLITVEVSGKVELR